MANGVLPSKYKQIRNLLIVLVSGIACAAIMAGIMLHYYGVSGRYLIENVLLDPGMLSKLSYDEANAQSKVFSHYTFDHIEYSYWSPKEKKWKNIPVSPEQYRKFYDSIKNEKSVADVSDDVDSRFGGSTTSTLTIFVKAQEGSSGSAVPKAFQTLQFAGDGEYYRVELREQAEIAGWAYFHRTGIGKDAYSTFNPQAGL